MNVEPYSLAVQNLLALASRPSTHLPADSFLSAALDLRAALSPEHVDGVPENRLSELSRLVEGVDAFRIAGNLSVDVARAFVEHLQQNGFLPPAGFEDSLETFLRDLIAPSPVAPPIRTGASNVHSSKKTIIGFGWINRGSALAVYDNTPFVQRETLPEDGHVAALGPPPLPNPRPKTAVLDPQNGKVLEAGFLWVKGDTDEDGEIAERDIRSPYRILDLIGRGGNGFVYRAVEEGTYRIVAVKILALPVMDERQAALRRFQRERELQGGLSSDRVVRVFATGRTDSGDPFIAMEFLGGGTLHEWIWRRFTASPLPYDLNQAVGLAAQAAAAMRDAHRAGIIHRDLKPDNCLLTSEGRLKLGDFGIAQRETERAPDPDVVGLAGTLGFMSPERLKDDQQLLAAYPFRDDVFALGALLYEILTGRNPFYQYVDDKGLPLGPEDFREKNDIWPLQLRILVQEPPPPSRVRPHLGIPENLDRIALKALSKDPARRHADVQEFLDDLVTYAAQNLEKTADESLTVEATTHSEENIRQDAWRQNLQRALAEYRRAHDEYPSEALRGRMVDLNLKLHTWADRQGDDETVRRAADRIRELAPTSRAATNVSRPIAVRFELDGQLPKGAAARFTLSRFVNRAGYLSPSETGKTGNELPDGEITLARGFSYTIRFEAPGVAPVCVPLPVRPGSYRIRIPVYPRKRIPAGFVVVPAGPAASREHPGSYSERFENWRVVDHDYAVAPPVTSLQWWSRLHRLYQNLGASSALERMPRHWKMDEKGRFALLNGQEISPHASISHVLIENALEFLNDWGDELGVPLRMPTLNEWKRALRGNDARPWPWGNASPEFGVAGFRYSDPRAHGAVVALPNDVPGLKDLSPFSVRAVAGSSEERLLPHVAGNIQKFLDFGTSTERHLISKALGISEETLTSEFYLVAGASYEGPAPIDLDILQYKPRREAGAVGIMPVLQLDKAEPTPAVESLIALEE